MQKEHYSEEIDKLKTQKPLSKTCAIRKLSPFLDQDGLLRVEGRIANSRYLEYKEKHPVILPRSAQITTLLIRHLHHKAAHQGRRSTIGFIRLHGYWIVGIHTAVSSVIHNCVLYRNLRGKTEEQQMAPLPTKRIEETPPFTYVGCDIFGPFLIKERRMELKRYGAIFTCMALKAIHIELVDDLTTDAFINTLRGVITIRRPIRQIHTDRGTNFIGAANELHRRLKQDDKLQRFGEDNSLEFVTNVPYASQMGGIWEREIRSIRAVLEGLLKSHHTRLDTSSLRTLMYEVMAIINCRSITIDNDGTVLHPNMLLTMKSQVVLPPPGNFDETDVYSRKRWIQVQAMANEFWNR